MYEVFWLKESDTEGSNLLLHNRNIFILMSVYAACITIASDYQLVPHFDISSLICYLTLLKRCQNGHDCFV